MEKGRKKDSLVPKTKKDQNAGKNAISPAKTPAVSAVVRPSSLKNGSNLPAKQTKRRSGTIVGMADRKPSSMRAVRKPSLITVRKKERSPFPISTVFTFFIVTALLLLMMMNYVEIYRYNGEINAIDKRVTALKGEKNTLSVKLDQKDRAIDIDTYARETLGMVPKESLTKKHVDLVPEDKSTIIKYDDEKPGGIGVLLAGIGEMVRDFLK